MRSHHKRVLSAPLSEGDFYYKAVGSSGSSVSTWPTLRIPYGFSQSPRGIARKNSRSRSIRLDNAANEPGCKALQSAAFHDGISQS